MTLFTIIRMIFLVIFVLLNTAILATAAVNLATLASPDVLRPIEAFQVFYTTLSILFLFPIILIDVLRTGSLASKVWFECAWLAAAALFNLVAAAAGTGTLTKCSATDPNCSAGAHVLLPITWVATLVVSAQLALIGISATFYSKRYPDVWSASVRDFAWFSGGGAGKGSSLDSGPPTPNFIPKKLDLAGPQLESMTERWAASQRRVSVLQSPSQSKAAPEPQPLTLEYAPELSYTRAPMHYNASAAISVGVLPQRKPSKNRKPAPALYPTAVQIAINATSPTKPTSAVTLPPSEPLPIRNWPRANPVESTMKEKIAPVSIPAPSPSNPLSPVSRRAKHRPPPLDLSAALPTKHRK